MNGNKAVNNGTTKKIQGEEKIEARGQTQAPPQQED